MFCTLIFWDSPTYLAAVSVVSFSNETDILGQCYVESKKEFASRKEKIDKWLEGGPFRFYCLKVRCRHRNQLFSVFS